MPTNRSRSLLGLVHPPPTHTHTQLQLNVGKRMVVTSTGPAVMCVVVTFLPVRATGLVQHRAGALAVVYDTCTQRTNRTS